jgi:hypothetical protein
MYQKASNLETVGSLSLSTKPAALPLLHDCYSGTKL